MTKTLIIMTAGLFLVGAAMVAAQPPDRAGEGFLRACDSGRIDSDRCADAEDTDRPGAQARRAAHHAHQAWEAIQDAVFRLELLEHRARIALQDDNLTPEQEANLTAKIDRIQAAQDDLLERAIHLRERVEGLKERWSEVREDMDGREPVIVCHADRDGQTTLRLPPSAALAHLREHAGDHRGPCAGDVPDPSDDGAEDADPDDADDDTGDDDTGDDDTGGDEDESDE